MSMRTMQRHRKAKDLIKNWSHPVGTQVVVTFDNGSELRTTTRSDPWILCDSAVIMVDGVSGGYALERVRKAEPMGAHLVNGEFQSDKYPSTPAGKVPLSTSDTDAQDLLWEYAQRRRKVDAEFSDDLEQALLSNGFKRPT